MDFALVSHLATVKLRISFSHFFDGTRTSNEFKIFTKSLMNQLKK